MQTAISLEGIPGGGGTGGHAAPARVRACSHFGMVGGRKREPRVAQQAWERSDGGSSCMGVVLPGGVRPPVRPSLVCR